jgi:hypothetical protein
MNRRQLIIAGVLVLALGGVGAVAWGPVPASGDVAVQTNTDLTVTFQSVSQLPDVFASDGETINVTGGDISSTQGGSLSVASDFNITGTRTFTVGSTGAAPVWVNKTDSKPVAIDGQVSQLTVQDGIAANDGSDDLGLSVSGEANVTVTDLPVGETLQLVASDGTVLAVATADSDGTAEFTSVEEGSYSNVEIRSGVLEIRTVAEQPQLVESTANVTVRLFEEDEDRVFVREATNGTIPLGGFPDDTQFSALVAADGFETRRSTIDSVRDQSTIYLLPNATQTSLVRFNIEDRTGDFSGDTSATIQIERSINTTTSAPDEEEYQVIAGDVVGGQLTFDTTLEDNVRYRVSVSNQQGQSRQLGAFSIESSREINLVISGIDQGVDPDTATPVVNTTKTGEGNNTEIKFMFTDPQRETTQINVRIENAVNSSDVLDTASDSGEINQFQYSRTLSDSEAEKQWVANYSYVRNGQTTTGRTPFGVQRYPVLQNLGQGWQQIFGVGALLVMGGIFSVGNARIGALIIPGAALTLYMIGFLDGVVTIFGVGVAFSVGVAVNLLAGDPGVR